MTGVLDTLHDGLGGFDDTPFINLEAMMELLGTMVDPQFDRFNGAMPYDRALYETSGKLVDWMNSIGVGFYTMGANAAYGATPMKAISMREPAWAVVDKYEPRVRPMHSMAAPAF